jgi:hypothetical protein
MERQAEIVRQYDRLRRLLRGRGRLAATLPGADRSNEAYSVSATAAHLQLKLQSAYVVHLFTDADLTALHQLQRLYNTKYHKKWLDGDFKQKTSKMAHLNVLFQWTPDYSGAV